MEYKRITDILEDAGFTDGESKVYLALLSLGESKVGPIITKSQISRSKVYDILERLISKGVCSKFGKNGVKVFQPLPPDRLLNIIKDKRERLKQEEQNLKKILPELLSLQPEEGVSIQVYEGFSGFKTVIDTTIKELKSKDTYEVMGISKTAESMRHYARKIYEAQKTKKFKARSIFDKEGAYKIKERENSLHEIRTLPKGWDTPVLFTIYGNTVGIHLGKNKSIISLIIKNKDIVKSFRATFKAMWKISKK